MIFRKSSPKEEIRKSRYNKIRISPFKKVDRISIKSWLLKLSNLKERLKELTAYPIRLLEKAFIPKREDEVQSSKSPKINPTN